MVTRRIYPIQSKPGEFFTPEIREFEGRWFMELQANPYWISMGYAPRPHTRWQWFRYHVLHGLMMNYGFIEVVRWSLKQLLLNK